MDSLPNFPQRPFAVAFMALPTLYVIWLIVSMVLLWASPVIILSFAVTMAVVKAFMWGVIWIWILVVVYLVMKIAEVYLRLSAGGDRGALFGNLDYVFIFIDLWNGMPPVVIAFWDWVGGALDSI